jgi:preprotein translocase subunit SecG
MREQESQKASDRPGPGSDRPQDLSADGSQGQEFLTVAANTKSLRRSTTLVAVLVGIGLICLLLMIRRSQPQAAGASESQGDQTKIEAAITRLTGVRSEMVDRMDEIVQKFYEFSDVVQVKVGELSKNPFEVENSMKDLQTVAAVEDPQAHAEQIRRQRVQEQAKTLKLLSIMRSEQGDCCMINDQILRQGDVVSGFTIARVGSNFVELVWPARGASDAGVSPTEEMKIELKLSE